VGDTRAPLRPLLAGAPQVGLLSPLLFALYVRAVPQPDGLYKQIALYSVTRRFTPRHCPIAPAPAALPSDACQLLSSLEIYY
jgi:hypothetical protein